MAQCQLRLSEARRAEFGADAPASGLRGKWAKPTRSSHGCEPTAPRPKKRPTQATAICQARCLYRQVAFDLFAVHFGAVAGCDDFAAREHDEAVGEFACEVEVLLTQQNGDVATIA